MLLQELHIVIIHIVQIKQEVVDDDDIVVLFSGKTEVCFIRLSSSYFSSSRSHGELQVTLKKAFLTR
ncbi:hypothetical protein Y032_0018g3595 [Ancylostoma ceylanicum]|uniref:Uncharacterized protein n=1 Tax=Ancylostoma ceylanicum TaxID=53326 RepID=A0A016V3R4_9BILA|nr:hypothetical protein Y032_0018g3595 [Ancylostoma ceylanicum]